MDRRIIQTLIGLLLLLAPLAGLAQPVSLRQALEMAKRRNEQILQKQEVLEQKKLADREAWGNFLPSVDLKASYTHLNDPMQIDLNPIREAMIQLQAGNQTEFTNIYRLLQGQAPLSNAERLAAFNAAAQQLNSLLPEFVETFKEQDYKTATLVGVQPLFLGGKLWAAKKFAGAEKQAALADKQVTENQVQKQVVDLYLQTALLKRVVETRENVLAGMERHRQEAKRLIEEGLIPRYHLLRADVAVANARRALLQDQNNLALAKLALKHALGLTEETPLQIADEMEFVPFTEDFATLKGKAVQSHPVLQLVSSKRKAASQKLVAERSAFLPQVAAFGKYELYPEYLSSLEPRWAAGIQLSFNLFNGFKSYHRVQSARHLRRQVELMEKESRRKVDLWLESAWREVTNAQERYRKSQKDLALAKENVRLNEKRFHSGLGTSLEVIDAHLMLEKTELEQLAALYEYYSGLANLYAASGNTQKILTIWEKKEN
ncbi:MAG: TolC family protein [Calditrichia bacterium]